MTLRGVLVLSTPSRAQLRVTTLDPTRSRGSQLDRVLARRPLGENVDALLTANKKLERREKNKEASRRKRLKQKRAKEADTARIAQLQALLAQKGQVPGYG